MEIGVLKNGSSFFLIIVVLAFSNVYSKAMTEVVLSDTFDQNVLPVFVEYRKRDDIIHYIGYAIVIKEIVLDGIAIEPKKARPIIETPEGWKKSSSNSWKVFNIYCGEISNYIAVTGNLDDPKYLEWRIPLNWKKLEVKYAKRCRNGDQRKMYQVTYIRESG